MIRVYSVAVQIEQVLPGRDNSKARLDPVVYGPDRYCWRQLERPISVFINDLSKEDIFLMVAQKSIDANEILHVHDGLGKQSSWL